MYFYTFVKYHCDLMSDYRLLDWSTFKTKEEAEKWCDEQYLKYCVIENDDPENPVSDLYWIDIEEIPGIYPYSG